MPWHRLLGHAGAVRLVVDGMNVIGSRPDGWWRDRAGAQRRLVGELAAWAASHRGDDVIVVFDGRPKRDERDERDVRDAEEGDVEVRFAPGGPNAADGAIVALVEKEDDPGAVTVVTSDRALADAVRGLGATVEGVAAFRRRLSGERPDDAPTSGRRGPRAPARRAGRGPRPPQGW